MWDIDVNEAELVVGGGLAGSEAAWQRASSGVDVVMAEMRPVRPTPVHRSDRLAELVCSNSLRGDSPTNAVGLLKREMGKSRLVIDAAWTLVNKFPDGAWLVELASLADPALVPSAITVALGITVAPSEDPLSALTSQIGDGRLLIVLDNCEHVVDAVASVLEALLSAAPNAHALVSSQELIGIGGEHVLRLPSLTVPPESNPTAQAALAAGAVQLFVARAQAADPRFVFDERAAPAVTAICRRLDGIPLALEMAAARVPLLGLEGLAARLDERFRVLTAGKRTALPRQRTLHATLDWSLVTTRVVSDPLVQIRVPRTTGAARAAAPAPDAQRVYVETHGCQMNVADSDLLIGILAGAGYARVERADDADVMVVNTCAVREKAEAKVLARAHELAAIGRRRPGSVLAIVGCMAEHLKEGLAAAAPVDVIAGPDSYRRLPELLALSRADITTKRPERKARGLRAIGELEKRIARLAAEDAKLPPQWRSRPVAAPARQSA